MSFHQTGIEHSSGSGFANSLPVDFSVESLDCWLQQLPMANAEKAGQALLAYLGAAAGTRIRSTQRFELLECIRPYLWLLLSALDTRFVGKSVPFDVYSKTAFTLSLDCHAQFARGYRLVSEAPEFHDKRVFNPAKQAVILYRFLHVQAHYLVRLSASYRSPDKDFWKQVYQSYNQATRLGFQDEWIRDTASDILDKTSLSSIFKSLVLFAVSDYRKYRSESHSQIYRLIARYAEECKVVRDPSSESGKSLFVLDLDSHTAPSEVQFSACKTAREPLYFCTRAMVDSILSDKHAGSGIVPEASGRALVYRVIRSLGAPERRRTTRVPEDIEVETTLGLSGIVSRFQGDSARIESRDGQGSGDSALSSAGNVYQNGWGQSRRLQATLLFADFSDFELLPVNEDNGVTGGFSGAGGQSQSAFRNPVDSQSELVSRDEIWGSRPQQKPDNDMRLHRGGGPGVFGRKLDSSVSGICLVWKAEQWLQLVVGQLLAIDGDSGSFELGIIRWIDSDDDRIRAGIEILSLQAELASVSVSGRSGATDALIYRSFQNTEISMGVVIGMPEIKPDQVVDIRASTATFRCRLDTLEESSSAFGLFSASRLSDSGAVENDNRLSSAIFD